VMPRIARDRSRFFVLDAYLRRRDLASTPRVNARMLADGGRWGMVRVGLLVHGDGVAFEEAATDTIDALRVAR
jgi:hypothetical protein